MLFWSFFGDLWMQKRGGIQMFWLFLRKTINERPRMIPSARTWCTPCEISCDSRMFRTGLRLSNLDILRRGLGSTSSDWDWLTPEAWDWYLEQWIFDGSLMYIIYLSGGETDHILQFCSQWGPTGEEINGEVNQLTVGQRSRQTGTKYRFFL